MLIFENPETPWVTSIGDLTTTSFTDDVVIVASHWRSGHPLFPQGDQWAFHYARTNPDKRVFLYTFEKTTTLVQRGFEALPNTRLVTQINELTVSGITGGIASMPAEANPAHVYAITRREQRRTTQELQQQFSVFERTGHLRNYANLAREIGYEGTDRQILKRMTNGQLPVVGDHKTLPGLFVAFPYAFFDVRPSDIKVKMIRLLRRAFVEGRPVTLWAESDEICILWQSTKDKLGHNQPMFNIEEFLGKRVNTVIGPWTHKILKENWGIRAVRILNL